MSNQQVGNKGEKIAATFLTDLGYDVMHQNYRAGHVEIDLICREDDEIVFVEVKTRYSKAYGRPEDAVTIKKQRHIIRGAERYLYENRIENVYCRFDVIAITLSAGGPKIDHFKNAFTA